MPLTSGTLTVEIAFGAAPDAASPTWTNVTPYVRTTPGVKIKRGRSSRLDRPMPGTCRFTLDNRTRLFDPTFTTGAYYAGLVPRVPIRVRGTVPGGSTYTVFRGVLDGGWAQRWAGRDSVVEISAIDAIGALAQQVGPPSVLDSVRSTLSGRRTVLPLGSGANATEVDTVAGTKYAPNDGPVLGPGVVTGRSTSTKYARGQYHATSNPASLVNGGTPTGSVTYSVEMWVSVNGRFADPTGVLTDFGTGEGDEMSPAIILYQEVGRGGQPLVQLTLNNLYESNYLIPIHTSIGTMGSLTVNQSGTGYTYGTEAFFEMSNSVLYGLAPRSYTRLDDGLPHHIVLTRNGSTSTVYVDGALWVVRGAGGSWYSNPDGAPTLAMVGNMKCADIGGTSNEYHHPGSTVEISDFAIYNGVLTAGQVSANYTAGHTARANETIDARATWLVGQAGWGLNGTFQTSSLTTPNPYTATDDVQATLAKLEETEQGMLWVDRSGLLQFRQRGWAWTDTDSTVVQATFNDTGTTDLPYLERSAVFTLDDTALTTEATVNRVGGQPQTAKAATAPYGRKTLKLDALELPSDSASRSLAEWFVYLNQSAKVKVESLTMSCQQKPASLYPVALQAEPGWLVRVKRTLPVGVQVDVQAHVLGIEHTITDAVWETTLHLDGTRAGRTWFTWGTSTWGGTDGWSF